MIRLLLLLLSLSLSTVFVFIPDVEIERFKPYNHEGKIIMVDTWALPVDEGFIDFFAFSDQKLSLETYLFFLFEHFILIILAVALYIGAVQYRAALFVYIVLQSIDTLIYVLAYGNFQFSDIPISWNFMKVFIFGLAVWIEYGKHRN